MNFYKMVYVLAEGGRRGELFQKIRKGQQATQAETRAIRASEV